MKHQVFLLIALLALLVGGISCSRKPLPTVDPEETVLRFGIDAADFGHLDPHQAAGTNDRTVVDMVFNGLVRYEPGNTSSIEPDLAEEIPEPERVDGKQVWTVKLRKGVLCHPGPKTEAYELTADDVVYSLQKSADPKRSAYAGEYTDMSVEKVDDYTVKITLQKPLSRELFLPKIIDYAGGFIVCQKAIEAMGDEAFDKHPVGTGPFMFSSYVPQEKVRLVANQQYFRAPPLLDAVEALYMPDISSRELALRAGELDVIDGLLEPQWAEKMEQWENIVVDVHGVGETSTLHFNTKMKPLDDVRVRQAIAYALNRDELLAIFSERVTENVYSVVPVEFDGLTKEDVEDLELDYAVDLEKARQLLAEAGHPDGFPLEVVTSEREDYRLNYENMRTQLAQIGIDLKVNVVDHSTMHKQIRDDVNPLVIYVAWRPSADAFLTRFFHSDSIVVTGAKADTNFSHYDQIDDLIEAARFETDKSQQIERWQQAQIKILEDMVAYPLHHHKLIYARQASVDYGHLVLSSVALYPQITEQTRILD